ncbi:MAG: hypothetical protein J6V01_07945, partial [Clostridia bacterium]|nr:hypothetical protein [Clostridia bacterium]
ASCGSAGAGSVTEGENTTAGTQHTHVFGEWVLAEGSNCEKGLCEERYCECGETERHLAPPAAHAEADADGKCTRCGEFILYSFPVDRISKLPGTIVTKTNKYEIVNGYYGAVIDLTGIDFDHVTLNAIKDGPGTGYAFLRELPVTGKVPSYADGYTEVVWDGSASATFAVPADAKYLYVYYASKNVVYLPEKVEFFNAPDVAVPGSFTIAAWNIGHFSKGSHRDSDFKDADYETAAKQFSTYIDGCVGADLFILNEYSRQFTPSNPASSLFGSYVGTNFEGEQRRYSCNAIYSKLALKNVTVHEFECNRSAVITYTTAVKAPDYYYITAELDFDGGPLTIVAVHLAFDDNLYDVPPYIDTVCQNEMKELIEAFKDTERVIMLGDWNAYSPDYFGLFTDAGYKVCNDGSYLTCTGSKTGGLEWAVDNIVYKGVSVSGFRKIPTALSDHIAIAATVSPVVD